MTHRWAPIVLIAFAFAACDQFLLVEAINGTEPDVLFLALGTPKQEKWLYRHRARLDVPVAVGVGASFDFEAGRVRRAPRWMQCV